MNREQTKPTVLLVVFNSLALFHSSVAMWMRRMVVRALLLNTSHTVLLCSAAARLFTADCVVDELNGCAHERSLNLQSRDECADIFFPNKVFEKFKWNCKNSIRFEFKFRWPIRMDANCTTKRATVVGRHRTHPLEPWIVFTLRTHPICRTHTHLSTKRCCDKSVRYSRSIHTSLIETTETYTTHINRLESEKQKFHLSNSVSNNFVIESKQQREYLAK